MRILLTTFGLYKKSGWGRTFSEAKGLAALGHQVTLMCSMRGFGFRKSVIEDGVKIVAFHDIIPERFLGGGYGFCSLASKLLYSLFHSFDICLANHNRDGAYYPCALNRAVHRSKLVIECWDNMKVKQEKEGLKSKYWFLRILAKRDIVRESETKIRADGVVALASLTKKRAIEIGVSPDKIKIIRGGCDIEHIVCHPLPAKEIKQKFGIPVDYVTFGLIGDGDWEKKDMGVFLEAMMDLSYKYKIMFLNFGKPFKQTIIDNPQLKDIIHECGWIDYVGDNSILSATDVFILIKQDNEENRCGWPNKVGDYLACGRPVLVNPYGELIPFIQEWNPGFIKVEYSKDSIVKAIADICEGQYDLIQLGVKNHEIACSNSWLQKAKQLEALFFELINRNIPQDES